MTASPTTSPTRPATEIVANEYGKARVRVARVERGDRHRMVDRTVQVALRGAFEPAYLGDDNSRVLATDTMKNTVWAFTEQAANGEQAEHFALRLHEHLLDTSEHVRGARIEVSEAIWRPIDVAGEPHPHAFEQQSERRLARVDGTPRSLDVHGGIADLSVLKTTDSWFRGFPRDQYTTLPETDDRVFATIVNGTWRFADLHADFAQAWVSIRAALVETFAQHRSPSVQTTLHEMAVAALAACDAIDEVSLALPNRHYLPLDLTAIGGTRGAVLQPTDEPHGQIEATVRRR